MLALERVMKPTGPSAVPPSDARAAPPRSAPAPESEEASWHPARLTSNSTIVFVARLAGADQFHRLGHAVRQDRRKGAVDGTRSEHGDPPHPQREGSQASGSSDREALGGSYGLAGSREAGGAGDPGRCL